MTDLTPAFLSMRFGFTQSIAATVAVIVTGGGTKVAARERELSLSTVRQHIQAAFMVTGAHTQTELTAICWRAWSAHVASTREEVTT